MAIIVTIITTMMKIWESMLRMMIMILMMMII